MSTDALSRRLPPDARTDNEQEDEYSEQLLQQGPYIAIKREGETHDRVAGQHVSVKNLREWIHLKAGVFMSSSGVDADLLRSRYRLTKQRAAILAALADGAHLTAESLLERVRAELPGVSLGTIYRTVDILRELGLVQIFAHNGLAARYEASLSKHHHLVCDVCHDITNVNIPALEPVVAAAAAHYRYDKVHASLTMSGRCANCTATNGITSGGLSIHAEFSIEGTPARRD